MLEIVVVFNTIIVKNHVNWEHFDIDSDCIADDFNCFNYFSYLLLLKPILSGLQ